MRVIADEQRFDALVGELAERVARVMTPDEPCALIGIRNRGDLIAQRLAEKLAALPTTPTVSNRGLPDFRGIGSLDITLYRDDLSELGAQAVVRTTDIPFAIDGIHVVLVDDVLMTGRSIRAAMQSLIDLGRPRRIWLAVLVDRGGRELPIAPDFVALDLTHEQLAPREQVSVRVKPLDDADRIAVEAKA